MITFFEVTIAEGPDGRLGKGGRRIENFPAIGAAERSARALVRWHHGRKVTIVRVERGLRRDRRDNIATVSADALGRIWTDISTLEAGSLL